MHKRSVLLFSLSCLIPLAAFRPQAQQEPQQPEIRVEVEAVNVLVSVTDKQGRFVTDLPQSRFRILENGKPQQITNFRQETDLPLKIALIMDTSASVRLKMDFEKQAAVNFLRTVMRPQDRALLAEFDTGVTLLRDFTSRPSEIANEIDRLRPGGGTALYDALYAVCRDKMLPEEGRKIMVLISDGEDRNSKYSQDETLRMLLSSGSIVYAVGTNRFGADQSKRDEQRLEMLAERTGGRAFFPYSAELLGDAFDRINSELRSQYSITYVPVDKKPDGKFREIEIKLQDDKGLQVKHRRGYFASSVSS